MVCLGFKPGVAGWKARTNPLSYGGGTPIFTIVVSAVTVYLAFYVSNIRFKCLN